MSKENINTDYLSIWKLVWPQALTLIATLAISLIDTWVASKINPQVLASFGILNQSLMFLSIIGQGVVGATLSLVGQAIGAGKNLRAKYISVLMTLLACLMGILVAWVAYIVRVPFLLFFKTPTEMLPDVTLWLVIYLLTIPLQYIFLTMNAVLRSIKRVKTILVVAILTAILNTVLSICLTFGYYGFPLMGATGIAVATLITLAIINVVNAVILHKEDFIRLRYLPVLRWCKAIQGKIYSVAVPIIGTQILWQTGYILVFAVMAHLPEIAHSIPQALQAFEGEIPPANRVAIAGFTVGLRIESMLFIPGMAMQFTASILISHLVGAKEYARARLVGTRLIIIGVLVISTCALPVWIYRDSIVALFSPDPFVQHDVKRYLFYNLLSIPFIMVTITGSGVFTGSGATKYTFIAYACSMWFFRLPLAYILGIVYKFDSEGVYGSMLISAIVQALIILICYMKTNWEGTKKVIA